MSNETGRVTRGAKHDEVDGAAVRIAPEVQAQVATHGDVFQAYPPPFDLISDMLLVGATCPVAPLRDAFPGAPFLSVAGRALLGIWFTRVLEANIGPGANRHLGPAEEPDDFPYAELNVAVLLRGRRIFVPGIYATSELTLRLGHRYGMPKQRAIMTYEAQEDRIHSRVMVAGAESLVAARIPAGGRTMGAVFARTVPWWSWPVYFPSGSCIEGLIESAEHARVAWLQEGRLSLGETWLRQPVDLWRVGLHVPRQRMRLPSLGT